MRKNKVQFQARHSLFEFFQIYGTETQCTQTLFKWRGLQGMFV